MIILTSWKVARDNFYFMKDGIMKILAKFTMTVIFCSALTACGGGGGGDNGSAGLQTFIYKSSPATSAGITSILNQEGAKGYFYQGNDDSGYVTVNDGTKQTYSYELGSDSSISFMNQEGAKGYRYEENFLSNTATDPSTAGVEQYNIRFRKDSASSATYTHAVAPMSTNTAVFLTQANDRGRSGYWFAWNYSPNSPLVSDNNANLYIKNNASKATYDYHILAWPSTQNDLLNQLNSEGAKGYRALASGLYMAPNATIYIKDQTQAATFTYRLLTGSTRPTVAQKNSQGAQGYAYWGAIAVPGTGSMGNLYVKADNCQGWLCTAINPVQ
jgi:hypothetical protein